MMRDRLIELIKDVECHPEKTCPNLYNNDDCPNCIYDEVGLCNTFAKKADYLLANGVIVPPMKLGQICFAPCEWRNEVDECRVSSITQKADGSLKIRITNLHYKSPYEITTDKIGKTVFLTKEEAEHALKGGAE